MKAVADINGVIIAVIDITEISTKQFNDEDGLFDSLSTGKPSSNIIFVKANDKIQQVDLSHTFNKSQIPIKHGEWLNDTDVLNHLVISWAEYREMKVKGVTS